jgi:antitoxin PrlF
MSKLSSRGQVVLPKSLRDALRLQEGDQVAFLREADALILVPIRRRPVSAVLDALPGHSPREPLTDAELREAERRSARERWERARVR